MYFRWLVILQMNLILVLFLILARIGEGFSVRSNNDGRKRSSLNLSRNFFSVITGLPPQALLDEESLKDILQTTSLQGKSLQCVYKATQNGWSATDFHDAVDDLGSGLVVALSRSGALFGGFNPLGWRSTDDYFNSNSAFLWYSKGAKKIVKTPILQGGNAAIFDFATGGPCFGAADLQIGSPKAAVLGGFAGPSMEDVSINAGNLKEGSSSLGYAYRALPGWPVRGRFQLVELEVYVNAELRKEKTKLNIWPFF